MKYASTSTKTEQKEKTNPQSETAVSPQSTAITPPSYGIEFVDGQTETEQPQQGQGMVIQAKMLLGAPNDRYEQEADKMARQAVRGIVDEQRPRVQRHSSSNNDMGTAVSPAIESAINQAKNGGRPLPKNTQQQMSDSFHADFSDVRIHTDKQANELNHTLRAEAFTVGQHIFFRQGEYSPTTSNGQELIAHELTHVVQQNGARIQRHAHDKDCNCPSCNGIPEKIQMKPAHTHNCNCHSCQTIQRKTAVSPPQKFIPAPSTPKIQRHSSFEHRMLGDVDPNDLEILGAQDNLNESGVAVGANSGIYATGGTYSGKQIKKENVLHVLNQEIARLEYMRDHGQDGFETKEEMADRIHDEFDGKWQVKLVTIPNDSVINPFYPPLVVTYGELNTLADIYGSIKEMKETDPKNRWKIVQGIRQQSLFMFYDMVNKVEGNKKDKFSGKTGKRKGFEGAIGSTGRKGERGALGQKELADKKFSSDDSEKYKATLARNACHFAPESWHSWAEYHQKARDLAKEAREKALSKKGSWDDEDVQKKINEAFLNNGFGDHFLQDSFASGHLINKTQIMMWLVDWIDSKGKKHGIDDESWRQIRAIVANQTDLGIDEDRYDLENVGKLFANDMQFAENLGGHWFDRFSSLGLTIPKSVKPDPDSESWQFLSQWQLYAAKNNTRELPPTLLEKLNKISSYTKVIHQLVADNVVQILNVKRNPAIDPLKHKHKGTWKYYRLHPDYVPSNLKKFTQIVTDINGLKVTGDEELSNEAELKGLNAQDDYGRMAAAITYKGFHNFMRNSRLQFATNVLHNKFCEEGLLVKTGEGTDIGRIYGDNAMLNANSSKGVKYSAETARMSLQAIQDVLDGKKAVPLQDISNRFPAEIKVEDKYVSLAKWNQGLKKVCEEDGIFQTATSGVKGFYTKSISLGDKISIDDLDEVHKGEAF